MSNAGRTNLNWGNGTRETRIDFTFHGGMLLQTKSNIADKFLEIILKAKR